MKHDDIICFTQRSLERTAENDARSIAINAWMTFVGALSNGKTAEFFCNVVDRPNDKRPGLTYHKWLAGGDLIHEYGFDKAHHFIKLPKTFLDLIITPESSKEIDGEIITTPAVTNREIYYKGLRENQTRCLVKIFDNNYEELKGLITDDFSNIYAEQYYFKAIAEGGEFYKELETIV